MNVYGKNNSNSRILTYNDTGSGALLEAICGFKEVIVRLDDLGTRTLIKNLFSTLSYSHQLETMKILVPQVPINEAKKILREKGVEDTEGAINKLCAHYSRPIAEDMVRKALPEIISEILDKKRKQVKEFEEKLKQARNAAANVS